MREWKNVKIDVDDYSKNTTWLADMDVFKKWKETDQLLNTEVECKGYFYARRMPTENIGTLYECIRNHKGVKDIMIDYEPISDLDVNRKIQELYDDILVGSSLEENERRYLMAGIYFMISGTKEGIKQEFQQLKKELYLYGCRITPFYFKQFSVFKAFANEDFFLEAVFAFITPLSAALSTAFVAILNNSVAFSLFPFSTSFIKFFTAVLYAVLIIAFSSVPIP